MAKKRRKQRSGTPTRPAAVGSRQRAVVAATAVVWVALSIFLALRLPEGEPPDEAAHLAYIDHLAQWWTFLDFRTQPKGTEAHQPPLYYGLCAALRATTGAPLVALRLVSTACGLALLLLAFIFAREVFPASGFGWHWTAAAVVGFLPMNLYVCSAVNNDPLVNCLVAATLLHLWRTRQGGWQAAVVTGLLTGLALLTKSTALALVGVGWVWFGWPCVRGGERGAALGRLGAYLAGVLVLWGPWAVRNTLLYGDPLAAGAFASVAAGAPPDQFGAPGLGYWIFWVGRYAWMTFWGAYDHLVHFDDFHPLFWYVAFAPVVLAALIGLGLTGRRAHSGNADARLFACSLVAGGLVLVAGFVSFNLNVFQAQARYFFCYLPVFALLLCRGLESLGPRFGRVGAALLLVLLLVGCADGVAWRMWFTG